MREARANRLARRACWRRHDGTLTRRARRAWELLTAATETGDDTARRVLLEAWLRNPREDAWEYVRHWCTPAHVLATAVDPARDAGSRARLGAYCVRNELVPDNPVECAVFFVLTGQHERYQALDPDATLLAGAYRGATEATREALRHNMIDAGALNLVRVIADRPDRVLTGEEADYLTRQLAGGGEWDRLWRLIPTMPLASAVPAARRFSDWWPADDLDRAFLARLAGADPDLLTTPAADAVTPIRIPYVNTFSFAPDGAEIAVRHPKGTNIYALPGGRQIVSHPGSLQLDVLALGDATIVYTGKEGGSYPIVRGAPGRSPEILLRDKAGAHIGRTPGGFVVVERACLYFDRTSDPLPRFSGTPSIGSATSAHTMVAADPITGNLAFRVYDHDSRDLVLVDADLRELARSRSDGPIQGAFCGPERLLLWQWGDGRSLELWRRDGADLVQAARIDLDAYLTPTPEPTRDRVVVRDSEGLVWLDAGTLTPVDPPAGFPALDSRVVQFSLDGTLAAVTSANGVEVHDFWLHQLTELAGRSLSETRLADLETLAVPPKRQLAPRVGEAVELLRACLEHRFGADVALGSSADRVAAGADDIALGGGA